MTAITRHYNASGDLISEHEHKHLAESDPVDNVKNYIGAGDWSIKALIGGSWITVWRLSDADCN